MNTVAIILAIVVVLLFYILYTFFLLKSTELSSSADLNGKPPSIPIVNSPSSTRYAYGIWIYVNSWSSSIADKTIFQRDNNIMVSLDKNTPTLKCDITMSGTPSTVKTLVLTDNFPLQKWVHIVISVDGQYVDGYLDGKLIKSGRMVNASNGPKDPPNSSNMELGSGWDANVSKFRHWSEPLNPQTVYDEYMNGNGQNGVGNYISSWGIDLSIFKDNVQQTTINLL